MACSAPNHRFVSALGALVLALAVGCVTPPEATLGQPVTQEGVSATVTGVELTYLDLEGPVGGVQTEAPLLVVRLSTTNSGTEPVRYDLAWGASAATQAQTALLFVDAGPEAEPTSGLPVARALLNTHRYLADPVTEARSIAAGETLEDILLFEAPPADATALVLSLPPTLFGPAAKAPAFVRIPWSNPGEIAPPTGVGVGEAHAGDGFEFTVTGTSVLWPRMTNSTDGKAGFSEAPLLRIDFALANTGESTIEYLPTSATNRYNPAVLHTDAGATVPRATFPPNITVDGLQTAARQIGPGERFENFMLFERPAAEVSSLRLVIPGARLGSTGIVRVELPYAWEDPAEPAELTPQVVEAPAPQ